MDILRNHSFAFLSLLSFCLSIFPVACLNPVFSINNSSSSETTRAPETKSGTITAGTEAEQKTVFAIMATNIGPGMTRPINF